MHGACVSSPRLPSLLISWSNQSTVQERGTKFFKIFHALMCHHDIFYAYEYVGFIPGRVTPSN